MYHIMPKCDLHTAMILSFNLFFRKPEVKPVDLDLHRYLDEHFFNRTKN